MGGGERGLEGACTVFGLEGGRQGASDRARERQRETDGRTDGQTERGGGGGRGGGTSPAHLYVQPATDEHGWLVSGGTRPTATQSAVAAAAPSSRTQASGRARLPRPQVVEQPDHGPTANRKSQLAVP